MSSQVYPIQGFPDQEICDVSTKLINEHLERFSSSSRILQQVWTNSVFGLDDGFLIDTKRSAMRAGLMTDVLVFAASDHRAGAPDPRSLHVRREQLQLLRVRRGEPGLHVQIPLCVFRLMRPTTLRDVCGPGPCQHAALILFNPLSNPTSFILFSKVSVHYKNVMPSMTFLD